MKILKQSLIFVVICTLIVCCFSIPTYAKTDTITITFHNNNIMQAQDVFDKKTIDSGSKISSFYDIPEVGDGYVFKGWYYGTASNSQPVDFINDTFSSDTEIYAQWIEVGKINQDSADTTEIGGNKVNDFDLIGVQIREEMYDENYKEVKPAGMRYVASLSNGLLRSVNALSDRKVTSDDGYHNDVEYGFVVTKQSNIDNWLSYAGSNIEEDTYKIQYNGTNVNGINTTKKGVNYQGFVTNVDCTSDDYSDRQIKDHKSFNNYRLFSMIITYDDNQTSAKQEKLTSRAYIRYYDSNGQLRTHFDEYNGTSSYGGCGTSYNNVENHIQETEPFIYYSSIPLCAVDVELLSNENADVTESNIENAVVGMKVVGNKCYMKLMKDTSINQTVNFKNICDFDLQGHKITSLSSASTSWFYNSSIYNGEWELDDAVSGCVLTSGNHKYNNIEFSGSLPTNAVIGASTSSVGNISVTNCSFDIDFDGTNNETYIVNVPTTASNTALTVDNCDINTDNILHKSDAYAFSLKNTAKTHNIKNTSVHSKISYQNSRNFAVITTANTNINNCDLVMDINEATSKGGTNSIIDNRSSGKTTLIKNSNLVTNINQYNNSGLLNVACRESSITNIEGTNNDINVKAQIDRAYTPRCIQATGTTSFSFHKNSKMRIKKQGQITMGHTEAVTMGEKATGYFDYCTIDVDLNLIGSQWGGGGVGVQDNATATFRENEGPVKVHGGCQGIRNGDTTATINVYGGKFSSPTHGGGYFDGKTNIYGGEFYNSYDAGEEPSSLTTDFPLLASERFGGMYVTRNAVVNAENARFIGGLHGLRLRVNGNETNNPIVNLTNCYVKGNSDSISVSVGQVNVNSGTVCIPEITGNGTTIIDNRT